MLTERTRIQYARRVERFREVLRARVRQRGDLARLADESGIHAVVIGRWITDGIRPSTENLAKLAPALGLPYEELLRLCGYLPGTPAASGGQDSELVSLVRALETGWREADPNTRETAGRVVRSLFPAAPHGRRPVRANVPYSRHVQRPASVAT